MKKMKKISKIFLVLTMIFSQLSSVVTVLADEVVSKPLETSLSVTTEEELGYIKEYNFTYSGILKSLVYFYEVKQNPVEKSNDGIGIVPWVYKQAFNYYYAIWLAQQKNTDKTVENYIPKETEIIIPRPKPKPHKKHLFSFLDDKED